MLDGYSRMQPVGSKCMAYVAGVYCLYMLFGQLNSITLTWRPESLRPQIRWLIAGKEDPTHGVVVLIHLFCAETVLCGS